MKCVKCGMDLDENTKFCGNCGEPVGSEMINDSNDFSTFSSEVSNEGERQPIVEEPIVTDTKEFKNQQEQGKKNQKVAKWVLIIFIVLALAAAGVFAYLTFFGDKKESYSASVDNVQKSIENFATSANESGTIISKIELMVNNTSLDFALSFKYQVVDNGMLMHAKLDENMLMDEMNMYLDLNTNGFNVYIPTSLFSLMGEEDLSELGEYIKFAMPLDELGIDNIDELLKELNSEENIDSEINLDEILDKANFKYVGKKDGLKQYSLVIDEKLLDNYKDQLGDALPTEELGDLNFTVNFYIGSNDTLEKFEMNMTDMVKDFGIEKFLFTMEFANLNSTTVEIPDSVKNNSYDISSFISDMDLSENNLF